LRRLASYESLKSQLLKIQGGETMVRALPRVWMGGEEYFRDDRLEEFRAVDNLDNRITFEEIRQAYLELISIMNYLFNAHSDDAKKRKMF
jgi:ABC-type uncharacterized transport system fused permease/ATPase subunit